MNCKGKGTLEINDCCVVCGCPYSTGNKRNVTLSRLTKQLREKKGPFEVNDGNN